MTLIHRRGVAFAAAFLGLCLSVAAAQAVAPEWSRAVGLDVWNLPALKEELRQANEERDDVVAQEEQSARRREAAQHVTQRLADGAPLGGAADELTELFRNDRGFHVMLELTHPDAPNQRHQIALHAIERVRRLLVGDDPDRRAAVIARLEAEYEAFAGSPNSPPAP